MSCLLVVGLGNPGLKYQNTRHNAGFIALDFLSESLNFHWRFESKFQAEVGTLQVHSHKVFFLKPHTFMNRSGESIAPFVRYFDVAHTLVIHDELDIALGDIRFKYGGSSGGHNGLKSIDKAIGSQYLRLRLGIGRNPNEDVVHYVLSDFSKQERECLMERMPLIQSSIQYFCQYFCTAFDQSPQELLAYLQNHFSFKTKSQITLHSRHSQANNTSKEPK